MPYWPSTSTLTVTVPLPDTTNNLFNFAEVSESPFATDLAADVATPSEYTVSSSPAFVAVTVTVRSAPASAATTLYLLEVAPSIGAPSRFHW
jgi:hypothetical protein